MNKKQVERLYWLRDALSQHGIGSDELQTLLRDSRILSRWAEEECNGTIQRDETGVPYRWHIPTRVREALRTGCAPMQLGRILDYEASALRRSGAIAAAHGLTLYHQTDPRGCALYLIRPGDVPEGSRVDECYTNGIAVTVD